MKVQWKASINFETARVENWWTRWLWIELERFGGGGVGGGVRHWLTELYYTSVFCIFNYIHHSASGLDNSAVWLLHGWCHMKLLPSHHTTMHPFRVSLHLKPHAGFIHGHGVTCHLHFLQNDQDLLHAIAIPVGNVSFSRSSTLQSFSDTSHLWW